MECFICQLLDHNTLCCFPTARGLNLFSNKLNLASASSSSNSLSLCLRKYNQVFLKKVRQRTRLPSVSFSQLFTERSSKKGGKCEGSEGLATPVRATAPLSLNSCSHRFAPSDPCFAQIPRYKCALTASVEHHPSVSGWVCAAPGTRPTRGGCSAILLDGISGGHRQLGEAKVK